MTRNKSQSGVVILTLFTCVPIIIPYMSSNVSASVLGRLGHINPLRSSEIPLNCYFFKKKKKNS